MDILTKILYSLILACSLLYIWHKLLNKRIDFKNHKLYITLIGITFISLLNYFMVNKFIKITIITIIFMIFFKYLFNEKFHKCVITPIFYQIIIMISETIYLLSITILGNVDINNLLNSYLGTFMTNVVIALISVILINIKFIIKIYNSIITFTSRVENIKLIFFSIISIVSLGVFPMTIYYKLDIKYLLIFYSSMIILCNIIVFYSFKTQNNFNKVSDKYNVAKNSLRDYESMITKYRIANHENKNLLLTIRAMILNKEKNIPNYIDSIVENKYNDDEKLLFEISVIPTGGLRATIYSEILKIKANNIEYFLNIDKQISTIDFIELDENTIIDVCKIIGVFIDNAIDEVKNIKKKNIYIDLYVEDENICIKVANNFKNKIDIEKIFETGYTTKGKGHGYGLSLVKQLIKNNNLLNNTTSISKDIFSQILIIKYQKKSLK